MILSDSATPMYIQIKNIIKGDILSHKLKATEKIPTENDLINTYNVSRVTIRKAINELVNEGLLVRQPGKGTFVTSLNFEKNIDSPDSWTKRVLEKNQVPKTICNSFTIVTDEEVSRHFNVKDYTYEEYIRVVRTRYINSVPVINEINFFPLPDFGFLCEKDVNGSLFSSLQKHRKISKIIGKNSRIYIKKASSHVSQYLNIDENEPLFFSREIYFDQDGNFLFFNEQYIDSDKYVLKTDNHEFILENIL